MSERPDELRDDLLGARLKSALGTTPPELASRLELLTAAGLHSGSPESRSTSPWLELAPQLAGAALLIAFLAGVVPRFLALVMNPSPPGAPLPGAQPMLVPSGAWTSLMLPIGVLLWVEVLRGAPTVRRWLR